MTIQNKLLIIAITWATLFVLYSIKRFLIRDGLLTHSSKVFLSSASAPAKPPGTILSKVGVLFVFAVNIITIILLLIDALSSSIDQYLVLAKVNLPLWANIIGSMLFVIDSIWGFFAMVFNPNYTPLYKVPPQQFILATQGPYGIIRHPRYASEAFLNIALFLFTGIWLPLLGLIGWVAIYQQALAEENYLMALAVKEYGAYRKKTNMFFPKPRRKHTVE
jgi:protein-S-isoprenylcysteine O-methyltransferase Ste14